MKHFFEKVKVIFKDKTLLRRILFVLGILVLFRLLAAIPVPGINPVALEQFLQQNQFFGLLNIFSGGGLKQLSILMLGVGPFITTSIILQLLTVLVPKLKDMYHEQGEAGRKKFYQYSRYLTIPVAALQAIGLLLVFSRQGILPGISSAAFIVSVVSVVAGSVLLTWIGELVTEFGLGNGVSVIIFAGIVVGIPRVISQVGFSFTAADVPMYIAILVAALIIIAGVVAMNEAERIIPVHYAKQSRGGNVYGGVSTHIPLKINQAGVMPIIFALSILLFPQMLANFFANSPGFMGSVAHALQSFVNNQLLYGIVYFVLTVAFTFFYSAITFDAHAMASNLHKNGAFIPGIRPGDHTEEYLHTIVLRLTFVGGMFLGIVALIPIILQSASGISGLTLGGTSILIVVGVILEMMKRLDAQVAMRQY